MGDGKALQMGTSHELGQNFARAFGIQFSSDTGSPASTSGRRPGARRPAWSGRLIMAHGDDSGLRLPPRLAPVQVVVLLVRDEEDTRRAATALVDELRAAGHRVRLDDRVGTSFGRRSVDWELKGVPVRVEVGPRDLVSEQVTLVRRDRPGEAAGNPRRALPRRSRPIWRPPSRRSTPRRRPARPSAPSGWPPSTRRQKRPRRGSRSSPGSRWAWLERSRLAADGFSVRCLQAAGRAPRRHGRRARPGGRGGPGLLSAPLAHRRVGRCARVPGN